MLSVSPLSVAALAVALLAGWAGYSWEEMRGSNARQADRIAVLELSAKGHAELIDAQAKALADRQAMTKALDQVTATTARLGQQLDRQGEQLAAGLEELKRDDPEAREYLRGAVPAAVGMRHARPETTDPAAYREGAPGVRLADPVPTARPPSSAVK